jgi:hypothetical protein
MLGAWEAPFVAHQFFWGVFSYFSGEAATQKELDRGRNNRRRIIV